MAMVCLQSASRGRELFLSTLASLMMSFVFIALAAEANTAFYESFDTSFEGRWIVSESSDYKGVWKYDKGNGNEDYGLLASEPAKKYGIALDLPNIVDFNDTPVVLQYDLRLQKKLDCGGAYLKFLLPQKVGWTPSKFDDTTPYSIMFGPDKCEDTYKVHFIFRHKRPTTGEYVEHHLKTSPTPKDDTVSHVYTAVIYPNNTLQLLVDGEEFFVEPLSLLSDEDFEPSVVPLKTIPDPEDRKPADWDERAKIPNPKAVKPENWHEDAPREIEDEEAEKPEGWLDNEPDEIDDPQAVKPKEWDDEEDGEWEAPKVPNPKCYGKETSRCGEWIRPTKRNPDYKGKWSAPLMENPTYMGIWKPREINNPDWFELERLNIEPLAAIGIDIWTMQEGILFDNILITHDKAEATQIRETTWKPKYEVEKIEQEKQKLKDKASKRGPDSLTQFKDKLFELLYQIPELKFAAPYKEHIVELLEKYAEKHQTLTTVGIFGAMTTILALVYALIALLHNLTFCTKISRVPTKVPVSVIKKEDIPTPDDRVTIDPADPFEKADEPIEGTIDNAESSSKIEKEEEPNTYRRRHHRET